MAVIPADHVWRVKVPEASLLAGKMVLAVHAKCGHIVALEARKAKDAAAMLVGIADGAGCSEKCNAVLDAEQYEREAETALKGGFRALYDYLSEQARHWREEADAL